MKKVLFVALVVVIAACMAFAQGPITGNTAYTPTSDIFGAHENGGRGCAGCHAPHSGGRGSGGNIIGTGGFGGGAGVAGDTALWGTDTTYIGGQTLTFYSTYPITLSTSWSAAGSGKSIFTGVVTCLSCHDGNLSRGAMMSGVSYEQAWGLLNFATTAGSNGSAHSVNLYGSNPIPTLLGNDGSGAGDYNNDHPIGPAANLGAVLGSVMTNANYGFLLTSASNKLVFPTLSGSTPYGSFALTYGYPAVKSTVSNYDNVAGNFFLVCTTCHNQHNMSVYSSQGYGAAKIGNGAVTAARTIFFVNGPYNPGAPYDPQHIPSTMAFCQQCHFSMSSQYYGSGSTVGVAY